MKKVIRRIILAVLLFLVVCLVVAALTINSIAKAAVEKGGTYALGVPTSVDSISLSILRGRMKINGLRVANPEGFTSEHLMDSGLFHVELDPGSVLTDTVHIPIFTLDGLDVNIEQTLAGSNVSKILENLKRLDTGDADEKKPKDKGEGKKFKIDRIVIKNVVAHFHMLGGLAPGPITVKVPKIELTDVGSDDPDGVVVAELIRQIVPAILEGIVENAKGIIDADFLNDIGGELGNLAEGAQKLVEDVGTEAQGIIEGAGKTLEEAAGALEGIFGKKKPPADN